MFPVFHFSVLKIRQCFILSFSIILKKSMNHHSCRSESDSLDNGIVMTHYDFENPIYHADEASEEDCDLPEELARLLEQESKFIQPYQDLLEVINFRSEDCKKEVKIGAALDEDAKKRLIELLRKYVDMFAWSYQDMPGLDTDIVVHRLPLKDECPPMEWKLRRTRPDMAIKIKEEV